MKSARGLRTTLAALRLAGEKFRPLAWPLKSVFIKAKLQLLIRITKVDWPSSFARLRKGDVVRQAAIRAESTLRLLVV